MQNQTMKFRNWKNSQKIKKINIGIRLNPDTDAKTINEISTGKKENKFGVTKKKFLYLINKYRILDLLRLFA